MRIHHFVNITLLVVVTIITISFPHSSAHFFPNISSIPPTLVKNATAWDAFKKLAGCHSGQKMDGLAKLKQYFQHYGYINGGKVNFTDDFDDALETAVKTYQLNFNLNTTGELDQLTLQHLTTPRCGNPDIVNGSSSMNSGKPSPSTVHTVAHYSFFPGRPRWSPRTTQLTYAFLPGNGVPDTVKAVFSRAFERWSEVIPMTFSETASFESSDIRIGFFSGNHGDEDPFDGVLGTLAHAFSPPNGRLHLDLDENWVIDGNFINTPSSVISAVDLESVAVHEIGHLLGLGHSSVEDAIMYPTIASTTRKVELASDDVQGIQELYGSNPNYNGSTETLTPRDGRDTSGALLARPIVSFDLLISLVGLFLLGSLF